MTRRDLAEITTLVVEFGRLPARRGWTVWNINAPAIAFCRAMDAEALNCEVPMALAINRMQRPAAG